MTARSYGERVAEWLVSPPAPAVAFAVRASGVEPIDERALPASTR